MGRGNWFERFLKIFVAAGAIGLVALAAMVLVVSGFDFRAVTLIGWDRGLKAVLIFSLVAAGVGAFTLKKQS